MDRLRRFIHRLFGASRYHDQASAVTARTLRADLLSKRLEVYQRGKMR